MHGVVDGGRDLLVGRAGALDPLEQGAVDVERDQPRTPAVIAAADGLQHLEAAQVRPQRLRAPRPSRRPAGGSRGSRRSCAVMAQSVPLSVATGFASPVGGEAAADVEPPGLELGAVGGRGELAVAALGRDPRLAVELALRRQAEVAGRDVDHAVGELELVEELLLPLQQPLVLGVGVLDGGVDEHLDLVEPVHPDDAPGVLAVRAGLLAEARAERRVAQRQRARRRGSRRSGTPPSAPPRCRRGRGPGPRSGRRRRRPGRGSRCPPSRAA